MDIKILRVLSFDEHKLTLASGVVVHNVKDDRHGSYLATVLGHDVAIPYDDAAIIVEKGG